MGLPTYHATHLPCYTHLTHLIATASLQDLDHIENENVAVSRELEHVKHENLAFSRELEHAHEENILAERKIIQLQAINH